jgi:hypothetical protein
MADAILDINDASLGLWREGELVLASPGYALLDGKDYLFGQAARDKSRLLPRQINHRYWAQLDMEPLVPAFGPARHSADLVHSHLLAIHEAAGRPEQFLVAAPGSLQHDQLALLLGIVEQCPFSVAGLVDRAVAATACQPVGAYNWHVELQLNQALLTGMRCENGQLVRDNLVPIPGSGWLALQDALTRAIADAFIRQTRFDPRRSAANEQALYDALPGILERLEHSAETNVDLEGRQARVERSNLAALCETHYQRILRTVSAGDARVFLGATLKGMPELLAQIPGAVQCAADAVSAGVSQHRGEVLADSSGIRFITSLPAAEAAAPSAPAGEPAPAPQPEQTPAEKIPPSRCQMEFDSGELRIQALSGPAPTLNGETLSGSAVVSDGDRLELPDGTAWKLVAVKGDGA